MLVIHKINDLYIVFPAGFTFKHWAFQLWPLDGEEAKKSFNHLFAFPFQLCEI